MQYVKPVKAFQEAMNSGLPAVRDYYLQINEMERSRYVATLAANPDLDLDEKDVRFSGVISLKSLKARLDALKLVEVYAARLAELASTDSPSQFKDKTEVLTGDLLNLGATFSSLAGKGDSFKKATQYAGPVGSLVGLVGEIYLERQRDVALTKAIREADGPVTAILQNMRDEFEAGLSEVVTTAMDEKFAAGVLAYSKARKQLDVGGRQALLDSVVAASKEYRDAIEARPTDVIDAMLKAHKAFVTFAASKREPQNVAQLAVAIDAFTAHVKAFADAVQKMRGQED